MRRPASLVVVLWLGLFVASGFAGGSAPSTGPTSVNTRLPGGLTVLITENHAAPVVAASLFVKVGIAWETDADAGVTNLLQQVALKGTTTRSAVAIAETADDIGGSIGASAETDFSEIRGTALARRWRDLLELIADIALRPSLPEDELAREREIALHSLRNRQDQPYPLAFDTLMRRLYASHPYGNQSLGRTEVVAGVDRAALLAHYRRYYRSGRMILSVSGDVSTREVLAEVSRLFGVAPDGESEPRGEPTPPVPSLDRFTLTRPAAQTQILMGFIAPPVSHPDYAAVKVLNAALGGGMAGRLFSELRDRQGLAYSTGAIYPTRVGPSFLLAQIGTAPANAARAEEGMRAEIERIRREPVGQAELSRAKTYLLGQFALDRRTNARLAWYAAFFESAGVGHDFAPRYVRMVEAVTAADVQRVAGIYLASPTTVSLGPASR